MRGPTIALSILAAALSAGAMVPRAPANAPTSQHLARRDAPLGRRAPLAAQAHGLSKRQDDTDDADADADDADADALGDTEAVLDDAVADDGLRKRQDDATDDDDAADDGTDDTDADAAGLDTTEAEDIVEDDLAEADAAPVVAEDIAEVPAVPAAPAAPVAAGAAASPGECLFRALVACFFPSSWGRASWCGWGWSERGADCYYYSFASDWCGIQGPRRVEPRLPVSASTSACTTLRLACVASGTGREGRGARFALLGHTVCMGSVGCDAVLGDIYM